MRYEQAIFDHSANPEIRIWAYRSLLNEYAFEIASACRRDFRTAEQFDSMLKRIEELWQLGINELGDAPDPDRGGNMQQEIWQEARNAAARAERASGSVPSRVERLKEMIKQFEPKEEFQEQKKLPRQD